MSKTEAVIAGKRATTRANNKEAILIAAREVFTEIGFGGTTVRDIIRRTGLASGTFYNYFTGKEEVFVALIDDIGARLRAQLRSVRADAKNFEDFIETSFLAYFSYYANNPGDYGLLRSNRGREGGYLSGPQTRAGLEELREDLLQAIQAGIVPDLDVDFMTSAISGSAFSILDEMMTRTPPDPVQTARFASRLYLGGVRSFVTK